MVSTPNNPGELFYNIEKEPEDSCLYKRLKMDYNYGLGRIYTVEEIEKAKLSPGFDRVWTSIFRQDWKYLPTFTER